MRKNRLFTVTLLAAGVSLCGCPRFVHTAGPPCMGNGCPAGTRGEPPAAQHAEYKQPPAAEQPATAATAAAGSTASQSGEPAASGNPGQASGTASDSTQAASAQQKPGRFTRMLEALHLHSKS